MEEAARAKNDEKENRGKQTIIIKIVFICDLSFKIKKGSSSSFLSPIPLVISHDVYLLDLCTHSLLLVPLKQFSIIFYPLPTIQL
jgi:hypothetical protein